MSPVKYQKARFPLQLKALHCLRSLSLSLVILLMCLQTRHQGCLWIGGSATPSRLTIRLLCASRNIVSCRKREKRCRGRCKACWIRVVQSSRSAYSSPVIFVSKPNGSLRMCIHHQALNAQTMKDKYPIPCIDDLLDRLQGASMFSSPDLQADYHQICIAEDDIPKVHSELRSVCLSLTLG